MTYYNNKDQVAAYTSFICIHKKKCSKQFISRAFLLSHLIPLPQITETAQSERMRETCVVTFIAAHVAHAVSGCFF